MNDIHIKEATSNNDRAVIIKLVDAKTMRKRESKKH